MANFILIKTPQEPEKRFTDRCLLMVDATILEKGHNMPMDNYFSSTNLASKIKAKKLLFLEQ